MKVGKISFLRRMYLAITDFRMYPFIQKEKLITAIGYFFKLVLFIAIIIGAIFTMNLVKEFPTMMDLCDKAMPDFVIKDGILDSAENTEKELNEDWYLVVRDDANYQDLSTVTFSEEEEHAYYVLVLSDATAISMRTDEGIYELGGIIYESQMNFTKSEMMDELDNFYQSSANRLIIWGITSLGIFFSLFIVHIWTLIMYMISIWVINIMFGLRLKLQDYFKVAIYVSTLPIILETIAIIAVGSISEEINFIIVLISCVYIFYALRALKLDSFLGNGKGNSPEEKLKNAIVHAQAELEKQIEELEKEEKSKKEKMEELDKDKKTDDENNKNNDEK